MTTYDISPDGQRAVFGARGDVFTVPAKDGNTRNLTQTSGVHERNAIWSPDGKWIAYISDATGEDEIYIIPQDGSGPAQQLTHNGDTYKYHMVWSPDSNRILWSDRNQRLQYVDVQVEGGHSGGAGPRPGRSTIIGWSPDSHWITYAKPEDRQMPRIWLFSLADKKAWPVTDEWF